MENCIGERERERTMISLGSSSLSIYVRNVNHVWIPDIFLSYEGTKSKLSYCHNFPLTPHWKKLYPRRDMLIHP